MTSSRRHTARTRPVVSGLLLTTLTLGALTACSPDRPTPDAAAEALASTPDLLPVLKQAGVVDAGGAGLVLLLDSFLHVAAGRDVPAPPEAAEGAGLPPGSLTLVAGGGREELAELATQAGLVDLMIPRGGEGLKAAIGAVATVPVIYAAAGNCHVYVDASADLDAAREIILNAKTQRPGVCNAAETLLVHSAVADAFLPAALEALRDAGVELRGDERVRSAVAGVAEATEADWAEEYLALTLAVKVVDSVDEAMQHVDAYGSGHSEAIVTGSYDAARAFQLGVDAACVYVNASTRFTDGGQFGMGAEIGNSTQKLHARGPIGLRELCTTKYLVEGEGQVRP